MERFDPDIDILLPTYNGGSYLKEQLDSLLRQTYKNWRLIVRDDGSTDNTVDIVKRYSATYPEKIRFIEDVMHLGPCQSFERLLEYSTADYIMFCDQDDVWFPEKIEVTLKEMLKFVQENEYLPVLVHTDMIVADKGLNVISDSFWRFQHLNPALTGLNYILFLNNVTGCTIMINKELKKMALPIPAEAILHDWWMALVASAFGRITCICTPTMFYRQHGRNEVGAVKYSPNYYAKRVKSLGHSIALAKKTVSQSGAFYSVYKDKLSEEECRMVYGFSTLLQTPRIKRLYLLIKFKFRGLGFLRNLGIWTLLVLINGGRRGENSGFLSRLQMGFKRKG